VPALLIENLKLTLENGAIVQIKVWRLDHPTAERPHSLKCSLFYGRPGERSVGYDNEMGKGDHRHYRARQERYLFVSFERLLADFWKDVRAEIENERGQGPR
jgi:hypothetical protein